MKNDYYKEACKSNGTDYISPDLYEDWLEDEVLRLRALVGFNHLTRR